MSTRLSAYKAKLKAAQAELPNRERQRNASQRAYERVVNQINQLGEKIELELQKIK